MRNEIIFRSRIVLNDVLRAYDAVAPILQNLILRKQDVMFSFLHRRKNIERNIALVVPGLQLIRPSLHSVPEMVHQARQAPLCFHEILFHSIKTARNLGSCSRGVTKGNFNLSVEILKKPATCSTICCAFILPHRAGDDSSNFLYEGNKLIFEELLLAFIHHRSCCKFFMRLSIAWQTRSNISSTLPSPFMD